MPPSRGWAIKAGAREARGLGITIAALLTLTFLASVWEFEACGSSGRFFSPTVELEFVESLEHLERFLVCLSPAERFKLHRGLLLDRAIILAYVMTLLGFGLLVHNSIRVTSRLIAVATVGLSIATGALDVAENYFIALAVDQPALRTEELLNALHFSAIGKWLLFFCGFLVAGLGVVGASGILRIAAGFLVAGGAVGVVLVTFFQTAVVLAACVLGVGLFIFGGMCLVRPAIVSGLP